VTHWYGGTDGYSEFNQAAFDDVFAGGATLSFWTWLLTYGENGFGRFAEKAVGTSVTEGWALQCQSSNDSLRFEVGFSGVDGTWNTLANTLELQTAYHIALAYDSDSPANDPEMWINGVNQSLSQSGVPTGAYNSDAALPLRFGNRSQATDRALNGALYDVRMYGSILADRRIQDIYESDGRDSNLGDGLISMWPTQDGPVGPAPSQMNDIYGGNHGSVSGNMSMITQWGGMNRRAVPPSRIRGA